MQNVLFPSMRLILMYTYIIPWFMNEVFALIVSPWPGVLQLRVATVSKIVLLALFSYISTEQRGPILLCQSNHPPKTTWTLPLSKIGRVQYKNLGISESWSLGVIWQKANDTKINLSYSLLWYSLYVVLIIVCIFYGCRCHHFNAFWYILFSA